MLGLRLSLFIAIVLALLALHMQTLSGMVHTWATNTTYTHGFIVPLIAVYFAWLRRHDASSRPARTWWPGLIAVTGVSAVWTVATLVNLQVVAQFATVFLVAAAVLALAGPAQAAVFVLSLSYLVFAVPFGQGIVPLLMEWTADFTVFALDLVGIPVLRDGLYFSIPSGNFEVAETCSGVRYLLASASLGVAFAFLSYTSWRKRLVFILASLVVPIVANGLRAFTIVLIAHYSDMRLAVGVDHFIYGWVFFGFIIGIMFFLGARYSDAPVPNSSDAGTGSPTDDDESPSTVVVTAVTIVALIAAGPAFLAFRASAGTIPVPAIPVAAPGDWSGPSEASGDWRIGFRGADAELAASYLMDDSRVEVRIAAYGDQSQGKELVNSNNEIAAGEDWQVVSQGVEHTPSDVVSQVRSVRVYGSSESYLVWYWYQQGGETTTNHYLVKWIELKNLLDRTPAIVVAVAARGVDADARETLKGFLAEFGDEISACADGAGTSCVVPPIGTGER